MRGNHAVAVPDPVLERLVGLIREETGNVIPGARLGFLEEVAGRRSRAHGFAAAADYVRALASGMLEGEWEQLVSLITVKESYFFRAPQQFRAIERHVLPRLLRAKAESGNDDRTLNIWSAASARGEEPATLALILAEHEALSSWDWRVVATDIDQEALAAARRGLYGERAVSQVPERLLERWFTQRGGLYELSPKIRSRIDYRHFNLASTPYRGLTSRPFDLVLLRNVLIYFRRPLQRRVVSEVIRNLSPHGYLFLGASETLWQIFDRLVPVDLGQCFAYRHPEQVELAEHTERRAPVTRSPRRRPASERPKPPEVPRPPRSLPSSLFRPEVAEEAAAEAPAPEPVPEEPPPPLDGTTVTDEVRGDDSDHPPLRPGGSAQDLLLRAAEELADNRLDTATRLTAEAREADPSEPAVYSLEGFLHDLQGRPDDAAKAYRAALYLDPDLYQARVLLADCHARLGSRQRSEREYRQVLAVLERGGARDLVLLEDLPFPNRARAQRLCRQALGRRGV